MELSHNLKKILLVGMSALMLASVGAGTGNLTTNAKRRYRPRIARRYRVRRYRHRAIRRYRPVRRVRKRAVKHHKAVKDPDTHYSNITPATEWSLHPSKAQLHYFLTHPVMDYVNGKLVRFSSGRADVKYNAKTIGADLMTTYGAIADLRSPKGKQINAKEENKQSDFDNAEANAEVNLINKDREAHGISDVSVDPGLTKIARQRAKQTGGHYDSNGNLYMEDLADQDGISLDDYYGENIARYPQDNQTPKQDAKGANNELMNHDANSNWGHRHNILDPNYNYVGVGVDETRVVEDFES